LDTLLLHYLLNVDWLPNGRKLSLRSNLLKANMAVDRHEAESLFLLIIDEKSEVGHVRFLIFTLEFVAIAIELSRVLLLFRMRVCFLVNQRSFPLLRQYGNRLIQPNVVMVLPCPVVVARC